MTIEIDKDKIKILIADDDQIYRNLYSNTLKKEGYDVVTVSDGSKAIDTVDESFQLCLLDFRMPYATGLQCLDHIKKHFPEIQVIIISSVTNIKQVVAAMKKGAFWYLEKTATPDEIIQLSESALSVYFLKVQNMELFNSKLNTPKDVNFIGESESIKAIKKTVGKISNSDQVVLITGDTGVGKNHLASYLHTKSLRKDNSFIVVSCSSLSKQQLKDELFGVVDKNGKSRLSCFEIAKNGTVVIDNIDEAPIGVQSRLVDLIESKKIKRVGSSGFVEVEVDVDLIFTSSRDLEKLCIEKKFKEDLYYALKAVEIKLPFLAERGGDLSILCEYFLASFSKKKLKSSNFILSREAEKKIKTYSWPGNVRELQNALDVATDLCDDNKIREFDLSLDSNHKSSVGNLSGMSLADLEKKAIIQTLEMTNGKKSKAAKILGISEKSIYNKIDKYGLKK